MQMKPTVKGVEANFRRLTDVQTMLSLACILPLLQTAKNLVVFAQSPFVYVCDFTRVLRLCYQDIHDSYTSASTTFQSDAFCIFNSICDLNHDHIKLRWQPDLNYGVEHLVFEAHHETTAGSYLNVVYYDVSTKAYGFFTRELWDEVKAGVKHECQCKCFGSGCTFIVMLLYCC